MVAFVGSVVQSTATAAATAVRTQMQTTIPSHTNWTLVESTTMVAGSIPCDVYKCSSVGNGLGADFYVAIMQSTNGLYLGLAEGYNTSTHKPKRPAMIAVAALQTLQADGGVVAATAECDWFNGAINPGGGSLNVSNHVLPINSIDDYGIYVAADAIYCTARTNSNTLYAGAYDSMVPSPGTNDPVPLVLAKTGTVAQALRMPLCGGQSIGWACGQGGANGAGQGFSTSLYSSTLNSAWSMGSPSATSDGSDLYSGGGVLIDRYIWQNSYVPGSATLGRDKNGWLRGTARHVRMANSASGISYFDTITIDGVAYQFLPPFHWWEANPA